MARLVPVEDQPKRGARLIPVEDDSFGNDVRNAVGGFARSGMGIVSNLMRPFEAAIPGGEDWNSGNKKRMEMVDSRFRNEYGVNTDSLSFKGGKLAGDVAATAPVGGFLAKGVQAVKPLAAAVPNLAPALASGGFRVAQKATTLPGKIVNAGIRTGAGAATGAAMSGAVNFDDAGTGAILGGAMPGTFKVAGELGIATSDKLIKPAARKLMQSAIKPTIEQLRKGDAQIAIDTLIKYGISPTAKGVEKLRSMVDDLNAQISSKIANSDAMIDRDSVLGYLGRVRGKFANQVNPEGDLGAIQRVGDEFMSHPYFQHVEAQGQPLMDELSRASLGKAQALQAAGKLKTFAAQQQNLAHGGGVKLGPTQPQNQLYMNTGATGRTAISPSAYPTPLAPRVPGRYTPNIDRVPEGDSGFTDAMRAYEQRKADELAAQQAVEAWQASRGKLPVQQAQSLKQGTYKALSGKYGETGSAATEAQKALARGLKDEVGKAVPDVIPLNAEEARLIKTLGVTERRALMELNKNPVGLSALAGSPAGFAAFMADRSAAFKAIAARMVNQAAKAPAAIDPLAQQFSNPMLRGGLLAIESNQKGP